MIKFTTESGSVICPATKEVKIRSSLKDLYKELIALSVSNEHAMCWDLSIVKAHGVKTPVIEFELYLINSDWTVL